MQAKRHSHACGEALGSSGREILTRVLICVPSTKGKTWVFSTAFGQLKTPTS